MSTTEMASPRARLVLPGGGSSDARVEVIYQSRATRLSRALLTLGAALLAAPVLFFLPPHFLWPIVALAIGGYLAWRYWKGEYYVVDFEGRCPRCDTPLEIAQGARVRKGQSLDCYGCHRSPRLVVDAPEE